MMEPLEDPQAESGKSQTWAEGECRAEDKDAMRDVGVEQGEVREEEEKTERLIVWRYWE